MAKNLVGMAKKNTFLYFAYGSNLLTERIHINNPSARKLDIGKLEVGLYLNYYYCFIPTLYFILKV